MHVLTFIHSAMIALVAVVLAFASSCSLTATVPRLGRPPRVPFQPGLHVQGVPGHVRRMHHCLPGPGRGASPLPQPPATISLPHVYIFSMSLPSLAQHLIPVTLCDQGCKGWAFAKLCTEQPAFMQRVCPASCGICTQIHDNKDEL